LFVAAVSALGLAARGLRAVNGGPSANAPGAALAAQMAAVDSAVATGGRSRRARGAVVAAVQGPVDIDRADAAALDGLPGIGPALAQRIVDDRVARGPFGSLERLQDVRGVGPALTAKLAPLVTFSGPPRVAPPLVPTQAVRR
jgi:competence protein ComEA